ncbi:ATP-dependent RecD-like DNA helicase [Candidatus Cyanaurora vandensis]|uniref:SF1B family DNA helicase RecD2 n=1 Tax=Candidatus Cyanaurora vandensis TaxID=2714958 RepID=UPI00257EF0EA|nr:ATP-dependent RecD-like DNA helicase [Candidatus Cyanaurora vandensis]
MTAAAETLHALVERVTFHNPENGYSILKVKVPRCQDLVTAVGSFVQVQAGQTLALSGVWRENPRYGPQFEVHTAQETRPATLNGIEKYLGSGLIKGVGPVTAKRIVRHFGLETLALLDTQPQRLIEVAGVGQKRVQIIQKAWTEQRAIKEVMLFLQSHQISPLHAVKIFKTYREESIPIVTQNPYRLAQDVYGIGFVTADQIARNLGLAPDAEFRYQSGLLYTLETAAEEGHCYLPQTALVTQATQRLALKDHQPDPAILLRLTRQMAIEDQIIMHGDQTGQFICYKPAFFRSEQHLAERVHALLSRPVTVDSARVDHWLDRFTTKMGLQLSDEQRQAVQMAASARVLVLTGGPGCGKTFTTRTIVALWRAMGKTIALASPTGRAAQRLSEMTGQEAKTLHRLLEYDPRTRGFKRDIQNPLTAEAIVIDEASMLDLFLANSLLKAVAPNAQLLMVGDTDQLPSVGPGNVLQDLIQTGCVPVVRLTQVFRQAQTSQIISNAHRINQGQFPQLETVTDRPKTDCLWLAAKEPELGVQGIGQLAVDLLPKLGFNPAQDLQVLCPMTRGEAGTRNLNKVLQQLLNPPAPTKTEIVRGGITLRVNDRVIQLVNDYDREVFNGDLGTITQLDLEEQEITVQFGERCVVYDYADLNEIALAWAVSIHKSQGSEYPVVILPVYMQHSILLTRNLIYTGLTRAKQLAILVGPSKAIGFAIQQTKDQQRFTYLSQRLTQLVQP